MEAYQGKSVFGGIAIGKIHVYRKDWQQVERVTIENEEGEIARYHQAKGIAVAQLGQLYDKALREAGQESAAIFEVHQMMLEDAGYADYVENIIRTQKVNAEYAVACAGNHFSEMFAAREDEYMQARSGDMKDISERLLDILRGNSRDDFSVKEPVIVVAEDLAPSETVQLDKDMVLSFVTIGGSVNSHTAILARTMGIPALVGACAGVSLPDKRWEGKLGIVDGDSGMLYIDPEEAFLGKMQEKQHREREKKELLLTLKGRETITRDGQKLKLYANIGNMRDLKLALQNDAGGIGLFRSEFLYLEKEDYPTEEEQFGVYKTVAEAMAGKRVVIRTLDIGADKKCDYFRLEPEENPALGYRAIRICLNRPEVFKTQLRALFRASAYGRLAIMYPMITSVWEVRCILELVSQVKEELKAEGIAFGAPEQGIMIETPAAVMVSGELAKEVDFFSIGTNDLTQYTLAVDRQNARLDRFYDAHHPAVLRMIRMVVENAHKEGIWVGICGELGADKELTKEFLAMGVDELSVAPESILPIRKIVLETDVAAYQAQIKERQYADRAAL
ncbi:MAG: phosphoenolpyruvate--protein phosphotransferase [Roseburia sp.]|nr:phosphoenolpyruvate--protein phosphotransferase [Roseburia sp.]